MTTPRSGRLLRVSAPLALVTCALAGLQVATAGPAAADPPATDWHKLRSCESGNQYDIDTGNGYFGAYQFDLPTWHSVGGAGQPNLNPAPEQDYRALYLYRMRGWQPWGCASTLDLREDTDAGSHRVPSRQESIYLAEPATIPPATSSSRPPPPRALNRPATPPAPTAPPATHPADP